MWSLDQAWSPQHKRIDKLSDSVRCIRSRWVAWLPAPIVRGEIDDFEGAFGCWNATQFLSFHIRQITMLRTWVTVHYESHHDPGGGQDSVRAVTLAPAPPRTVARARGRGGKKILQVAALRDAYYGVNAPRSAATPKKADVVGSALALCSIANSERREEQLQAAKTSYR